MRFNLGVVAIAVLSPLVSAAPAVIARRSTSGCAVSLNSTMTTPANPAENILMKTMIKWNKTTSSSSFMSSYCNWDNTTQAPFSVFFYADTIPGYETTDELAAVLDTWVDTWLVSSTDDAATGRAGDYNITDVTCA